MKVLFLEVDTERAWAVASMGPAFIAAYLRANGHEATFLRARYDMSDVEIVSRIIAEKPDLIGISLTTRQWLRGRELVAAIRARVETPVIAGGLHATFSPEAVLASPGFDYVCLGEGEGAMLELVETLAHGRSPDGLANIWRRGGSRPELRPPFEPIDRLPFLARDFLDEPSGIAHIATQRGCPFPCTYCAARMYNELYGGTVEYGRRRSHQNVLDECLALRSEGKLAYVIFLDDTFTIQPTWVREFCRVYGPQVGAPFCLHARVETVDEKMLHLLAEAGCKQITYGVESGSERVRTEIMRRKMTNQRFRDVFRWTREAGIMVIANYMLGLPGETRDDLQQTLDLAEELAVLDFGYFVFYPYPGTPLFRVCLEKGYLPADYLERPANHKESILTLPDLSNDDIAEYYDRFTDLRSRLYEGRSQTVEHVLESARLG